MSAQLNEIKLSELVCFSDDAEPMELQAETFIFGVNGTGKSSIARKLKEQADTQGVMLYLFNQRYIRDLIKRENLDGVFQIRDASEEVQKRLAELEGDGGEIQKKRDFLTRTNNLHTEKQREIKQIESIFREKIWDEAKNYEQAYPSAYAHSFKGFRRKELLETECKNRFDRTRDSKYEEPEDLDFETRMKSLEQDSAPLRKISSEAALCFELYDEEKKVVQTEYRLNKDNPLGQYAALLDSDQWIKEGVQHLTESGSEICPFCQQSLSGELKRSLEQLINRDYEKAEACLQSLVARLALAEEECGAIKSKLKELESFETTDFENLLDKLHLEFVNLRQQVSKKLASLQKSYSLDFDFDVLIQCREGLDSLNNRISKYNENLGNRRKAKEALREDLWAHFIHHRCEAVLVEKNKALSGLKKAEKNLAERITTTDQELTALEGEYKQLLREVTSSEPVVEEINATLRDLNLRSFSLRKVEGLDQYRLVREDGARVDGESLSEGEKTFIAFLYFYHSVEKQARNFSERNKIVAVVDDPISSLDSSTLFAVSLLCRRLQQSVEDTTSLLEQIIFSTHNAYFFKELAFIPPSRKKSAKRIFHVLSKSSDGKSTQEQFTSNPIHSAYDQLWMEVRAAAKQNVMASHTLQNSMRRILENYFRLTGGMDTDFTAGMNGGEALVAESLLSWMNDGSHDVPWQVDYSFDGTDAKALVEIFRKIFEAANQGQHFELMMRENN